MVLLCSIKLIMLKKLIVIYFSGLVHLARAKYVKIEGYRINLILGLDLGAEKITKMCKP